MVLPYFYKKSDCEKSNMCKGAVMQIRSREYDINTVHEAADLLLREYSEFINTGSVPVARIAIDAGFKLGLQTLPKNMGGYIAIGDELLQRFDTDKIIVLNRLNNGYRRRFTLAHEFGHYLFDFKADSKSVEYYDAAEMDDDKSDLEILINRFAAELLMPKKLFLNRLASMKSKFICNDVVDYYGLSNALSEAFEVPLKAVHRRFTELGVDFG